jgi:hypothetical protein
MDSFGTSLNKQLRAAAKYDYIPPPPNFQQSLIMTDFVF